MAVCKGLVPQYFTSCPPCFGGGQHGRQGGAKCETAGFRVCRHPEPWAKAGHTIEVARSCLLQHRADPDNWPHLVQEYTNRLPAAHHQWARSLSPAVKPTRLHPCRPSWPANRRAERARWSERPPAEVGPAEARHPVWVWVPAACLTDRLGIATHPPAAGREGGKQAGRQEPTPSSSSGNSLVTASGWPAPSSVAAVGNARRLAAGPQAGVVGTAR